jgi:hypothetical protein
VPFRGFRRYSFSLASIRQNAPSGPGVYGIANADEWLFIGSGEDIRAALLTHLNTPGTALLSRIPTGFAVEPFAEESYAARMTRLILELKPSCNSR